MAVVKPFRALRYDEAAAGPLEALVAPPYDVISDGERTDLLARSPYNVVHLTLPESEEEAARALAEWRRGGILVEEPSAVWAVAQEYVGPDGVSRRREGIVASLKVEPYETKTVLPHERTHRGPLEGRLRLLRATRTQLEPIFLLYDGPPPARPPDREPDVEVDGAQLWRLDDPTVVRAFDDKQLLIADGHHRYETAVAFSREEGTPETTQMLVVLVSTEDEGLEIFPTHRLVPKIDAPATEFKDPNEAFAALDARPPDKPSALLYTRNGYSLLRGREGQLDVHVVEDFDLSGVEYTPDQDEAIRRVDSGEMAAAFIVRPTRIEDVFAAARRGEVLPQKTTYFYPKLISGLLFHPL